METILVCGIPMSAGYFGGDSRFWGVAEVTADILGSLILSGAILPERMEEARANLEHMVKEASLFTSTADHEPADCTICEWWPEDVDTVLDWLSEQTAPAARFFYDEGAIYLATETEEEE